MLPDEFPASDQLKLPSPGDRFGHYEIVEVIGSGGMGQVYRARDTRLKRDVALKIMNLLPEPEFLNRFEREVRAASAVSHPNICAVYDVGEADGRPFLVMELLEGKTLSEYMDGKPLEMTTALNFGAQIADALEAAHAKGIVHRDIKSGNIMITGRRHVKVLDFGLARLMPPPNSQETLKGNSLTTVGVIVGTPHYLSPEVLQGVQADARSDLWALGIVLYEMLCGQLPFTGTTSYAVCSAILSQPVPSLPSTVPEGLRSIVERCLAKRPADRYQSAGEVRAALETLQSIPATTTNTGTASYRPFSAGRRRWLWACAAAASAAAIAGVFLWQRMPETSAQRLSNGAPASTNQEANYAFELAQQFQTVQNDVPRAQQMLEQAVALDPRFAEARRLHATNYAILILNGYSNDASLLYKAEEELAQVSQIAPNLSSLPSARVTVYLTQGRKELIPWEELDRALRANPSDINNRLWRGIALLLAGETTAAGQEFQTILHERPLNGPARMFFAETLRENGDLQGAIQELNKVFDQAPNNISAIQVLTLAYLDNGELEKARKLLQDRRPLFSQNYLWRGLWALVLASAGDHEQALQALDEETLKFAAAAFPSTNIVAESYALLGETSRAIEWLERTVRNGDERTEGFRKSPRLASIRNDPRFQQIIDSVESRRINKGEKAHAVDK